MKKCSADRKIIILLEVMIVVFSVITVLRSFYTVDITDESFIYAETLLMLKGNIPYAINATDISGMCFLILPFVYFYKLVVPSLAGIVLFLRLCFSVIRIVVIYFVYRINRHKNEKIPCLLVSLLLTVWYYISNYFSYNSNAIWILILVSVWLYDIHVESASIKNYISFFFAGVLSAFAVFAHPFSAVPVALFVVLLLVFAEKGNRLKYAGLYCGGGLFIAFSVLVVIVKKTSIFKFYSGLRILSLVIKQSESFSKIAVWVRFFDQYKWLYLVAVATFFVTYIVTEKKGIEDCENLSINVSLFSGTVVSFLTFAITGFDLRVVGCYFGSLGILLSLITGIVKKNNMVLFISLPFFLFLVLELSGQRNGGELLHPSLATPTLMAVILLGYSDSKLLSRCVLVASVIFISTQLLYADVIFTYRDDAIRMLDTRVENGVYEGLITTGTKANCIVEMEEWIAEATSDCDSVLFRDNVPFAYLMYKGNTPELQSWDMLNFTARWKNNAKIMYNNFKNRGEFPKRIIYIDYGRDDCLSIETEWKFNEWVNAYYDFVKEEHVNEMFRVKIYDYNGTFDGDYSNWTNF